MTWMVKTRSDGLSTLMLAEAQRFVRQLSTDMHRSFRKRVQRLVLLRLELSDEQRASMSSKEVRDHFRLAKLAGEDATASRRRQYPEPHASVLKSVVEDLKIDSIDLTVAGKRVSMAYALKSNPERFLPALHKILKEVETAGRVRFTLIPMASSNSPGFVNIDQVAVQKLDLISKEMKREINRRKKERRDAIRPMTAALKEVNSQIAALQKEWRQASFEVEKQRMRAFFTRVAVSGTVEDMILELEGKRAKKRRKVIFSLTPRQEEEDRLEAERQAEALAPLLARPGRGRSSKIRHTSP
jgi:hypothetical protein